MKKRVFALLLALCALASSTALGANYDDFTGWQDRFLATWGETYTGDVEVLASLDAPIVGEGEPIVVQLWVEDTVLVSVQPYNQFPQLTFYMSEDATNQAASKEAAYALFAEAIYDAVLAAIGDELTGEAAADKAEIALKAEELVGDAMFPLRTCNVGKHTVMLTRDLNAPNLVATIMWELS